MPTRKNKPTPKQIDTLTHSEAARLNIPTAEYEAMLHDKDKSPIRVACERRNPDLDPQLIWRGKYDQPGDGGHDPSGQQGQNPGTFSVEALPLYIQEKVHPKVLIDDLRQQTEAAEAEAEKGDPGFMVDMFADFNGLPNEAARTEFYQHEANWSNRMILGDSLQVMASLAEREGLRGKVQCIYLDPPYGIKFNSNFQWSTTNRDVKDGKAEHITREPEQVKAFRDTWCDGIHSYLSYLRDRLTLARDLLTDSGSIFVQIGDENVHRVRAVMDEVFGEENHIASIVVLKTSSQTSEHLAGVVDYVVWYANKKQCLKYRKLNRPKRLGEKGTTQYVWEQAGRLEDFRLVKGVEPKGRIFAADNLASQSGGETTRFEYCIDGKKFRITKGGWKTNFKGMQRLEKSHRLKPIGNTLMYRRFLNDFCVSPIANVWDDVLATGFSENKIYVVQSSQKLIQRCILMTTDPGDLVLDPTCGSGTTATVAEQWGRRWITIDTSRVSLALARSRIMGARYPWYLLADSAEGLRKEAEITGTAPATRPTRNNIRQGFVYQRVPHVTLKSIANNAEIDVIWQQHQEKLEPLRQRLNATLNRSGERASPAEAGDHGPWEEWEVPRRLDETHRRQIEATRRSGLEEQWAEAQQLHAEWWQVRIARQRDIDAAIAARAECEYLYDKPFEDKKKVRVAGPFTVESLSPHRALIVDADEELVDPVQQKEAFEDERDFTQIILENLKTAGVQQASKDGKIDFISLSPWPGDLICAEAVYKDEDKAEQRAAIFIGPEFGTLARPDLVSAAREAADAAFDVLIACAFNFDAHSTELDRLGRIPILKARMNADLHMADDLKNTGKGNLFVIFGEPDIEILDAEDERIKVKINGVDVFHPSTGEIRSNDTDGIARWFIDTDYNEESFFVRHAYFLGANDPYKSLKTTLKAEINPAAWETLNSEVSRPFDKPGNGRIAVKVINHLGDEVMKVYRVG